MYYEEKEFGGELYYRTSPSGDWELISNFMLVTRIRELEAERNKLITAVADHVTVRAEQAEKIKQLKTQKFTHFNNEDAPAAIEQAIAEEREACAKTRESLFDDEDDSCNEADICAAAIRARVNTHETS